LIRNTADLPNVTCNQAAVWHAAASLRLNDFGPSMSMFNSLLAPRLDAADSPGAAGVEVQALALDDYADRFGAPGFVKIDAESAEWSILQGMGQLLNSGRPKLTLEVGDYGVEGAPPSRVLLDYVIDCGYAPFDYRDGRIRPHDLQDTYGYDNILLVAA
jgi:FkbM family methyltransferase